MERRKHVLFLLIAPSLIGGCADFTAKPLAPTETVAAFASRSLRDEGLRQFLEAGLPRKVTPWPPRAWDFDALTLAALYFHPDLNVARAQWEVAQAGIITAGQRPNPSVSISPAYVSNFLFGASPWIFGGLFTIPVETAGKRDYRLSQAAHLSESARLNIATAAWGVRSRLRASLLGVYAAQQTEVLLARRQTHQEEIAKLLEERLAAGEIPLPEVTQSHLALDQLRLSLREAQKQLAEVRVQLADAVGVPAGALAGVEIAFDALERLPADLPSAEIRRLALLNRPDILAALSDYEASQGALQLEIARQYPDVNLGSGYQFDQGDHKWIVGLSMTLPVLNQNEGPIATAEARRKELAARFTALQARVIGEIDRTSEGALAARQKLLAADGLLVNQEKQLNSAKALFDAGETDRLALLSAQLEYDTAVLARLDALVKAQQALGLLEDAVRRPLNESIPLPSSAEAEIPRPKVE